MKLFMIGKREALGLTIEDMAKRCECTKTLLVMVESVMEEVTHPRIAARIAFHYGLTVEEYNQLVHESHHVTELPKPKPKPKITGKINDWWKKWAVEKDAD